MCGRYVLTLAGKLDDLPFVEESAQLELELPWECYNVSPGRFAPILDNDGHLKESWWGLVPHWADSPPKRTLVNARAETAADKPSFRVAYKNHRCAVPASGYFEWYREGKSKPLPYYIPPTDGGLFWFAGLASTWKQAEGGPRSTFCVLTQSSQGTVVSPVHDRVPVVLRHDKMEDWLQGRVDHLQASSTERLARPFRVSTSVNSVKNDSPENIKPLER